MCSYPDTLRHRYGSARSSVYVALSCLVQQIKTESRADVFTAVRKLRSQRQGMIQHVVSAKYSFTKFLNKNIYLISFTFIEYC